MLNGAGGGRRAGALLVLLCAAALCLRWPGVGWGLPHQTYRDGTVLSTQVALLRSGASDPGANEFWGYYPHLLSRLVDLASGTWDEPLSTALDLAGHLERASEPWLTARQVSVLMSLAAIAGAYLVARRSLDRAWSLFAAALVATSIVHLSFGQQEKPHGPISATVVFAVLAAVWLRRVPRWPAWCAAICCAALAIATLQSGAFALGSAGVACLLILRGLGRDPAHVRADRRRALAGSLVALVVLAATVRWLYPFHFDDHGEHVSAASGMSLGGHLLDFQKFQFGGAVNMFITLWLMEPVMLVLSVVALIAFAARALRRRERDSERTRDLAVICGFVVPYAAVLCIYDDAFDRFLMPLVPFLAALSAYGAAAITSKLAQSLQLLCAALLLAAPTAAAVQMARVRASPDTQTRVAEWIRAHANPDEKIYVYPYVDLPLLYSAAAVSELGDDEIVLTWMAYQAALAPELSNGPKFTVIPPRNAQAELADLGDQPLRRLRERGARYVVVQAFGERYRLKTMLTLRTELQREAQLVFRASPFRDPERSGRVWIRYAMTLAQEPAWLRLFSERSVGMALEVYDVQRSR